MGGMFGKARSKARTLYRGAAGESKSAASSVPSSVPQQLAPAPTIQPPLDATLTIDIETPPLHRLQERIWSETYNSLREKEPKVVQAFEDTVSAELERDGLEAADRTEYGAREVRSRQMRQLVEKGLDRTAKRSSVKQTIDDSLQAVTAIRGIMDRAVHAAPEAAVVWATVCLGLEILSNPVTEALENRKGIQYVLSRMEWYWKLVDLLLDENRGETSTAALRDELEKDMIRLFEKLLLYQMTSTCLYHRSGAAVIARDVLRIDDWAGQLSSIKAAEEAVQRDVEQYNTQQANIRLQELNVTASALETNLQDIFAVLQDQTQYHTKRDEEEKDKQCLRDVRVTDSRTDKHDIEEKKGGLLQGSYAWIREHADFLQFRNNRANRLLWIKGDAGKGKTMLLCGIIDELERDPSSSPYYFFCQATGGDRHNTATSVLRGLIFDIARNNKNLIKYVRQKYDYAGAELFTSAGAWQDLTEILRSMLQDPSLANAILVVDALDECSVDRERLLHFISKPSSTKWIISSRNWLDIEESLRGSEQTIKLSLEQHQASISQAVDCYIQYKTDELAQKKDYDEPMKDAVLRYLTANANGTFLWVALVCHELANPRVRRRHTSDTLKSFPSGLVPLYERMLSEVSRSKDAPICQEILATVLVAYRPPTLQELKILVEALGDLDREEIEEVISSCGSFLTLRNDLVSFVHQSAKDYLLDAGSDTVIPLGAAHQHRAVFSRSLDVLSTTLHRDMYHLKDPGYLIEEVSAPRDNPLVPIKYSCLFWVRHLRDWGRPLDDCADMRDTADTILSFLQQKYLYWLEALSLLRSVSSGVKATETLENLLKKSLLLLRDTAHDARRFLLAHRVIVEIAPLQTYVSALVFSPTNSSTRQSFRLEEPDWIISKPRVGKYWTACLQTLETHSDEVTSVAFSSDSQRLASGSRDKTIVIWDVTVGMRIQVLQGHDMSVNSVAFSKDGQWLVSGSDDTTIKVWDMTSTNSTCLRTLRGHEKQVLSVELSDDGQRLVSGSQDETIKIWDRTSGVCLQTLEGHQSWVLSAVFSKNGERLASGSFSGGVTIWDPTSASKSSGLCTRNLEGHKSAVLSVVFSGDGQRLASGSGDKTVKIWDITSGGCLRVLEGHGSYVSSVVFSSDSQRVVSGSADRTVKIWDLTSSKCTQTLDGHDFRVNSVALSDDGRLLASGSLDSTIKIWDTNFGAGVQAQEGHGCPLITLALSNDTLRLACCSTDNTIQIWDTTSGLQVQTLCGHSKPVTSLAYSQDSQRILSGSQDTTVKIWDAASGTCLQTFEEHNKAVISAVFSTNGLVASGSADHTVKVWNPVSGRCTQTLDGHTGGITLVMFSNNSQRLATGCFGLEQSVIKIWDPASGFCLQTMYGSERGITSFVFSNDDRLLVSGFQDCTVKLWDVTSGVCTQTLSLGYSVRHLSFHPLDDLCLLTDRGAHRLETLPLIPRADQSSPWPIEFDGYGIGGGHNWIVYKGKKLLWLPSGYRPQFATIVTGSKVILGCGSRRVLVIEFGRIGQSGTFESP